MKDPTDSINSISFFDNGEQLVSGNILNSARKRFRKASLMECENWTEKIRIFGAYGRNWEV